MAEIIKIDEIEDLKNYDNDILKAISFVSEFWDVHSCAIVKNGIPTGVGLSSNAYDAKIKAIDCNPIDAIGATIAFSKEIDEITAKALFRMNFATIITTKIQSDATKYIEKSNSMAIELNFGLDEYNKTTKHDNSTELTPKSFKTATKLKPTQEQVEDMVFAWKVLKKTNKDAVIIAKDFKIKAIELGTDAKAIEKAMDKACDGSKEAILAISKNIIDKQQLHPAIQGRITGIIEPKSTNMKDSEIIKMAEKYGITIISVGAAE